MLVKLSLENFMSFKNKITLEFTSTAYELLKTTNVTADGILKGAIFVGGNATGKTNILMALKLLLELLFKDEAICLGDYKCLFSTKNEVSLNYSFKVNDANLDYDLGYDLRAKEVIERCWINSNLVFSRKGESYEIQNHRFSGLEEKALFLRTVPKIVPKMSGEGLLEFKAAASVIKNLIEDLSHGVVLDSAMKPIVANKDLGLSAYIAEKGVGEINAFLKTYQFEYELLYKPGQAIENSLFLIRKEISAPLPFAIESVGNKCLLYILPVFFYILQEDGLLIMDEFSTVFHNELEQLLIRFFMKHSQRAQVFLASHSTNLLANTIFRPDQEYAVAFKGDEGSYIKQFSSEKPRVAQNIEKMYTSGIFGGVPIYEEIRFK